jgi:hypothetical protein
MPDQRDEEQRRRARSLAALAFLLALALGGILLFRGLRHEAAMEDCLLAGRSNCDALAGGH